MSATQPPAGNLQLSRHGILGVVLIYAVFASFWILLSDKALEWLFHTQNTLTLASTMKGWLFVAITSLLLYSLLQRVNHNREVFIPAQSSSLTLPTLILSLLIISITIGAVIYTFSRHEKDALDRLDTISSLKTEQISNWLAERQQEAEFIQSSTYYAEQYTKWQQSGDDESRERLITRLSRIGSDWGIDGIVLQKAPGAPLWSSSQTPHNNPMQIRAEQAARDSGKIMRIGLYLDDDGIPHLDYIIPMSQAEKPVPLVILHINLSRALKSTFQRWPIPNAHTDTLIISRIDGHVVSLNATHPDERTTYKISHAPGNDKHIVQKLLTDKIHNGSIIKGLDSENNPAIGVVYMVPNTDWTILVKVKLSEVNDEAVQDSAWIILAGILALFVAITSLIMIRQNQRLTFAESIRQAQSDKLHALNLLSAIADSSTDAIYAKDKDGRYMLFNQAAEKITGMPSEQVIGQDDHSLFPPDQAGRIIEEDNIVLQEQSSYSAEEQLHTMEGTRTFLTTKGPLFDQERNVIGVFGISRDITARKNAEDELVERDHLLQEMSAIAHVGGWWFDPETGKGNWTEEVARIHDVEPENVVTSSHGLDFYRGEHRKKIEHAVKMAIEEGHPYDLELELISAKGKPRWVRTQGHPVIENDKVVQIRGAIQDITERKLAEFDIERQTEELRQRNEELVRFNRASIDREMDMIELKKEINRLSEKLGMQAPYDLHFLDGSNSASES